MTNWRERCAPSTATGRNTQRATMRGFGDEPGDLPGRRAGSGYRRGTGVTATAGHALRAVRSECWPNGTLVDTVINGAHVRVAT